MGALALIVLVIGVIVLGFALAFPGQFRMTDENEIARLVWLLAAAALVGSGAFGLTRRRTIGLGRALLYALVWIALFAGAVLVYRIWREFAAGPLVQT